MNMKTLERSEMQGVDRQTCLTIVIANPRKGTLGLEKVEPASLRTVVSHTYLIGMYPALEILDHSCTLNAANDFIQVTSGLLFITCKCQIKAINQVCLIERLVD